MQNLLMKPISLALAKFLMFLNKFFLEHPSIVRQQGPKAKFSEHNLISNGHDTGNAAEKRRLPSR